MIFVFLPLLGLRTVTLERHQGCWIKFDKGTCGFILCYLWIFCRSRSRSRSPLPLRNKSPKKRSASRSPSRSRSRSKSLSR
uniref:Transmembrane protein n=1 Tax=Medicago truncatula TaxID=3880 RepID=I3SSC6_MEDTR|nr:unknown [Medicago truncatula]